MPYTYEFPMVSATSTVVLMSGNAEHMEILIAQRTNEPYKNHWSLPGGFVNAEQEDCETAALRELKEETGIDFQLVKYPEFRFQVPSDITMYQFGAYSDPKTDPRCHVINVGFAILINDDNIFSKIKNMIKPSDDIKDITWLRKDYIWNNNNYLAFNHNKLIADAMRCIDREKSTNNDISIYPNVSTHKLILK